MDYFFSGEYLKIINIHSIFSFFSTFVYWKLILGTIFQLSHSGYQMRKHTRGGDKRSGCIRPRANKPAKAALFSKVVPFQYDPNADQWIEAPLATQSVHINSVDLKVCTMNVLFDLNSNEHLHTKKRIPALLQLLKETESHIIGLQVNPSPLWKEADEFNSIFSSELNLTNELCGGWSCIRR